MLPFNAKNTQELVEKWNRAIPIDRWYRERYHIAFNSANHRAVCLADMFYEFWEFLQYTYIPTKNKNKEKQQEEGYIRGKGNFMKEVTYSQQDIDKIFDELDLDNID